VGIEKPDLVISPPSGLYVSAQDFDLTLVVVGTESATAAITSATLDGADFMNGLSDCAVSGSLDAVDGVTFRCALSLSDDVGAGVHTFEATVEVESGMTASASATWEILDSSE
jgi:hypothetical protein